MSNETQRLLVIQKYYDHIVDRPDLLDALHELDDKVLACWCYPKLCHGNILRYLRTKQLNNLSFEKKFIDEIWRCLC
jgi:hypothetical protein